MLAAQGARTGDGEKGRRAGKQLCPAKRLSNQTLKLSKIVLPSSPVTFSLLLLVE